MKIVASVSLRAGICIYADSLDRVRYRRRVNNIFEAIMITLK